MKNVASVNYFWFIPCHNLKCMVPKLVSQRRQTQGWELLQMRVRKAVQEHPDPQHTVLIREEKLLH